MAEPNVNLSAGLVPPTGLPADLATQQLQLQIQQQLAEALLLKGQMDVPDTVPGPAGNPFARSTINIGGMLNKLINARAGQSRLNDVSAQQLELARQGQASYQRGIERMFGTGPENRPASAMEAGFAGIKDLDPRIQAIAASLLQKQEDLEGKQAVTPQAEAEWAKAGLTPESLKNATRSGWFTGGRVYRPGADQTAQLVPKGVTVGPEQRYVEINQNPVPGAPPPGLPPGPPGSPQPVPNPAADVVTKGLAPPPTITGTSTQEGGWQPGMPMPDAVPGSTMSSIDGIPYMKPPGGGAAAPTKPSPSGSVHPAPGQSKEIVSPQPSETLQPGQTSRDGTYTNPYSLAVTKNNAKGTWEVMTGADGLPESIAAKDSGAYAAKALPEGQELQLKAKRNISRIADVMQLAQERAIYGLTAEWQLKARRLLVDFGLSDDEAGRISASQTAVARLMITAAQGTKEITPRASQQLINAELEAAGASKEVEARHVIDIGGAMIADILNSRDDWNNKIVPTLATTPFGQKAHNYKVEYDDPRLPSTIPAHIVKNERGDWVNTDLVTPRGVHRISETPAKKEGEKPFANMTDEEIRQYLKARSQ